MATIPCIRLVKKAWICHQVNFEDGLKKIWDWIVNWQTLSVRLTEKHCFVWSSEALDPPKHQNFYYF